MRRSEMTDKMIKKKKKITAIIKNLFGNILGWLKRLFKILIQSNPGFVLDT